MTFTASRCTFATLSLLSTSTGLDLLSPSKAFQCEDKERRVIPSFLNQEGGGGALSPTKHPPSPSRHVSPEEVPREPQAVVGPSPSIPLYSP